MAANVGAHVTTGLNKSAAFARQGCRHIVGSKIFERGVLALILANCITLVLYNPMDPRCETTQCKRLKSCEISFSSLAFLECLVRITALGFKGFWSDAWNRLDLAIVTCGIIDFIPGVNSGSIKAFRTTRVLRPLRVVKRFPSLRILVRLLLDIIPMLGSVMVLCIFLFVTFGITSVQLWKGVLRNGCYNNDGGRYQPSTGGFYICSLEADDGMNACPADVQFTGVYASNYTECRRGSPNYQNGALSFDNIWMSFLAIFQVVTLEDWTGVMYALQDGYSFWVWPFFVLLIFFGSWFAINLALVVIATQFKVTKKRETLLIRAHEADAGYSASQPRQLWPEFFLWTCSVVSCGRLSADVYRQRNNGVAIRAQQASDEELEDLQMIKEVFDLLDKDRDGTISLKELRGALHTLDNHLAKTEVKELVKSIDENGDGHIDFDEFCQLMGCSLGGDQRATVARNTPGPPAESDPAQPTACKATFRARVQQVVDHRLFTRVVVFCIAANTLSMAAEHHGQPDELAQSVETTNSVFAFIFFAEVVLRVISVGPLTYFIDGFNVCDGIIVIMGIVEVFVPSGGFNVLRSFRLMRLFKLARYLPTMQKQLLVMLRTLDSVLNFLLLLGLFIFMFAVMGMHLFGGNWEDYSSSQVSQPRQNFDSFLYSILTVFQVLTTEEWNLLLYHTMHASSKYAALYYVILITIGTFILVNLFVAIMVEGFATDPEAIARFRAALERARDVFHTMQNKPEYDTPLEEEHVQRATSELSHQSMHTHKSSQEASVVCIPEERHRPNSAAEKPWCWPLCTSKVSPQCSSANSAISVEVPRDFEKQAPAVSPSLARQHQPCNWVTQRRCKKIMDSRMFNVSLMIVLCVDTIVMCVERPSIAEGSSERVVLNGIDVMCETIFTLEAIVKMFALGVRHHRNSYFKDKWNVYDLSLLVCSWSLLAIRYSGSHSDAATTTMWILQIYRTFRPFRLVQRIPSLKQTLRMLLMSVRPIGNLLLMGSVFYIIFAIWGVQMFKGGFFFCSLETVNTGDPRICQSAQSAAYNTTRWASNQTVSIADSNDSFGNDSNCSVSSYLVENEHDCKVAGGVWNRRQYNFDNVWEALVTLFVVSSRDGWTEIMRNGVDSVGAERHPQKDANLTAIVYFVTFLLIVGYFVISMFVGVIVENFQLSMPSNTISDDGDEEEGGSDSGKLLPPAKPGYIRAKCHYVMHHRRFEAALGILISTNVLIMALEHVDQPSELESVIESTNVIFTAIYCAEVVVKVLGVGTREFLRHPWNRFDTFVAVSSLVGCGFDLLGSDAVINPSVLQAVRVMRVARVVKLLKMATGLASLLTTVWQSMGAVMNLMMLLGILFCAASSLGMKLFGEVECLPADPCFGFSKHANFKNSGLAALTLFRVATGDDWVRKMPAGGCVARRTRTLWCVVECTNPTNAALTMQIASRLGSCAMVLGGSMAWSQPSSILYLLSSSRSLFC